MENTIKEMINELAHGQAYSIFYHDKVKNIIHTCFGVFEREDGESEKCFLKRAKRNIKEANEVDTIITVHN